MDHDPTLCEFLPWDSQHFGKRIAQVSVPRISPKDMENIWRWCIDSQIDCLYTRIFSGDTASIRTVERNGFELMDIRHEYGIEVSRFEGRPKNQTNVSISPAEHSEIDSLQRIASGSLIQSRFHADPRFPPELCNELYALWIKKSVIGTFDDKVIVARSPQGPIGMITCRLEGSSKGKIGLFAIEPKARGQGVSTLLFSECISWFRYHGISHIGVVTQGQNISAQAVYERFGFVTTDVSLWYHKWFDTD